MDCFQRLSKSKPMAALRKFSEGELAVLQFIGGEQAGINPSKISESMSLSRSRVASILGVLRTKGFVSMEIAADDRRKMTVFITPAGKKFLDDRYGELLCLFDGFIAAAGAKEAEDLAATLENALPAADENA